MSKLSWIAALLSITCWDDERRASDAKPTLVRATGKELGEKLCRSGTAGLAEWYSAA